MVVGKHGNEWVKKCMDCEVYGVKRAIKWLLLINDHVIGCRCQYVIVCSILCYFFLNIMMKRFSWRLSLV